MKKTVTSLVLFAVCAISSVYAAPNTNVSSPAPATSSMTQDELTHFLKRYNLAQPKQQASPSTLQTANALVGNAMRFLGIPYRYGGTSAKSGFDCSGLVVATFQQTLGKLLPRRASAQAAASTKIAKEELRPGDLVFFNTMRRAFSHVGIYIGDGKFIHSPSTGSSVRVDNMNGSYWVRRFNGARRVIHKPNANKQSTPVVAKKADAKKPAIKSVAEKADVKKLDRSVTKKATGIKDKAATENPVRIAAM